MFGVVPQSIWKNLNPPDANNMCTWAMRCLLVQHKQYTLLIDTGIGNKQSEKFFSFYYLHGQQSLASSLNSAGLQADDISDVLLTHLHFDHCGGAVTRTSADKLEAVFGRAKYWTNQAHWIWANEPNVREKASFLKENFMPLQANAQLHFVNTPSAEASITEVPFMPDISLLVVNGHTEQQMLPLISFKGRKILYCADLIPSVGHIPVPYVMAYDIRPLDAMREKEAILQRALAENWILFFEHDPVNECCTLIQTDRGIRADQCFRLSSF